jgi:hypothetical protein
MNTYEITKPVAGNGAHTNNGVDCNSMTIIEVSPNGKTVVAQRDNKKPVAGAGNYSNQWELTPNPEGAIYTFTLRKNGYFVAEGESMREGTVLHTSGRYEYYSYEF